MKTYYVQTESLSHFESVEASWNERKFTPLVKKSEHNEVVFKWREELEEALKEITRLDALLKEAEAKTTIERRDLFAAHALQGLLHPFHIVRHDKFSEGLDLTNYEATAIEAARYSDNLIQRLDATKPTATEDDTTHEQTALD